MNATAASRTSRRKTVLFTSADSAGPRSFGLAFRGDAPGANLSDGDVLVCDPDARPEPGDIVLLVPVHGAPIFARLAKSLMFWPVASQGADWYVEFEHLATHRAFIAQAGALRGLCKVLGHGVPEAPVTIVKPVRTRASTWPLRSSLSRGRVPACLKLLRRQLPAWERGA